MAWRLGGSALHAAPAQLDVISADASTSNSDRGREPGRSDHLRYRAPLGLAGRHSVEWHPVRTLCRSTGELPVRPAVLLCETRTSRLGTFIFADQFGRSI